MRKTLILTLALVLCLGITAAAQYEAVLDFTSGQSYWGPMGAAAFYITTEDARSQPFSLAIVGRSQTWEGSIFDIYKALEDGGVYNFSIWVKGMDAAPGAQVWITCVKVDLAGQAAYSRLCDPVEISNTEWVELKVENFEFSMEGLSAVAIYLEVDDVTASYFIDDFKITGTKPVKF